MKLDGKLPFLGALLKKEQDLAAFAEPLAGGRARGHERRSDAMFVDFLYELRAPQGAGRHAGGGRARARARGSACTTARSTASTTSRARCCVHSEAHLDAFDQAFLAHFKGVEPLGQALAEELLEWLRQASAKPPRDRTAEERRCSTRSTSS